MARTDMRDQRTVKSPRLLKANGLIQPLGCSVGPQHVQKHLAVWTAESHACETAFSEQGNHDSQRQAHRFAKGHALGVIKAALHQVPRNPATSVFRHNAKRQNIQRLSPSRTLHRKT